MSDALSEPDGSAIQACQSDPATLEYLIAQMLCYGVRSSTDQLSARVAAEYMLDPGFIQGTVFMVNRTRPVNTAFREPFTSAERAVELIDNNGELYVQLAGRAFPGEPLRQPHSILDSIAGYELRDYVRLHSPSTLFVVPVRECVFGAIGRPCQFCTYEMVRPRPVPAAIVVDMIIHVLQDVGAALDVAIGAGTPNLVDYGAGYFVEIARGLRQRCAAAMSVETVPPPDLGQIEALAQAGAGSMIMSIEVWDDAIRTDVCPGKSVVSKDMYRTAWRKAIDVFGTSQVSSVLIVGLEPEESTRVGIDALISEGVVPTLIPFRPYGSSRLNARQPVDHHSYLSLSRYCSAKLRMSGLSPLRQVGCTKCGGCSMEAGLQALLEPSGQGIRLQ